MTRDLDLHDLTGAYALDALAADERDRFEAHLTSCGPCARELEELRATASRLGSATPVAPPPDLRDRVLSLIASTPQDDRDAETATDEARRDGPAEGARREGPAAEGVRREGPAAEGVRREGPAAARDRDDELASVARHRDGGVPRWVAGMLGAAAALLLVAVGGLVVAVNDLTGRLAEVEEAASQAEATTSQVTEVLAAEDATTVSGYGDGEAWGRVVASPSRGEAVFVADGYEPAPEGHTYELWLIDEEGAAPAGLFDPDERGRVTRVLTGDVAGAVAIGVTVEPEGGSTEPTTEPMMVVELDA